MEMEERDATSRASFKCPSCGKTFTDLEVRMYCFIENSVSGVTDFNLKSENIICASGIFDRYVGSNNLSRSV